MAEIQMVSMWTKIASNLKSMKNNNLPNLLFEKYILCLVNIYDKTRQCIKKQRHHFADKGLHSQTYGFSNHHIWMWELNHKEGRVPKNWYFWTVVVEKTLESPLDNNGCESWTIKKAECQRTDIFELWWWRRLLRVPRTTRRQQQSNQSILEEMNPEYSLEGLVLKPKLQYFGHLVWRTD